MSAAPNSTAVPSERAPEAERVLANLLSQPPPKPDTHAFFSACKDGDTSIVVAHYEDLSQTELWNGLDVAVAHGRVECTLTLLQRGVSIRPFIARSALEKGSVPILDALHEHGWRPTGNDMTAAVCSDISVRWLLQQNVQPSVLSLNSCAATGSICSMDLLLESETPLESTLLLHAAAGAGRVDMLEHLLDNGLDINELDENGVEPAYSQGTPLHHAVFAGCAEAVAFLLVRGADPSIANNARMLPLQIARAQRNGEVMTLLMGHAE